MTRESHAKVLDIAAQLLAGMPSDLAQTMNDAAAADWAIRRAQALCDEYVKRITPEDMQS
jgi:hypothetical protein